MGICENLPAKETLTIEFKRQWWSTYEELIKDFIAMINTFREMGSTELKYFIIGIDEKDNSLNHYYLDREGKEITANKIELIRDKEFIAFKEWLFEKIYKIAKIEFLDEENNQRNEELLKKKLKNSSFSKDLIKDIFLKNIEISICKYKSKEILIFKISNFPFIFKLKNNHLTYRKEDILIREMTSNGPSISVLNNFSQKKKYSEYIKKEIQQLSFPIKSISKIVEEYKKIHIPTASIQQKKSKSPYSKEDFFELYILRPSNGGPHVIIYLSRYSYIDKTLTFVEKEYNEILRRTNVIHVVKEDRNIKPTKHFKYVEDTNKYFYSLQNFIDKQVYEPKKELLREMLWDGDFPGIFVEPQIEEENGDSIKDFTTEISSWLKEENSPILYIKGEGGIGKTTLAKKIAAYLKDSVDVWFIESDDIQRIATEIEGEINIYSLLAKLFEIETNQKLEEESLKIMVGNGNLIIILDGLEEVEFRFSEIDIPTFLEKIFSDVFENLTNTKIIITSRISYNIPPHFKIITWTLKGFDEEGIKFFVRQKTGGKEKKANKVLEYLKDRLSLDTPFSPMIVDLITEYLVLDNTAIGRMRKEEFSKSKYLIEKNKPLDPLLGDILRREVDKYGFEISMIDIYLEILMRIAVKTKISLSELERIFEEKEVIRMKIKEFLSNPLISYDKSRDEVFLKYDFLRQFLLSIKFLKILQNCKEENNYNLKGYFDEDYSREYFNLSICSVGFDKKLSKFGLEKEDIIFLISENRSLIFGQNLKLNNTYKDLIGMLTAIYLCITGGKKDSNTEFLSVMQENKEKRIKYLVLEEKFFENRDYRFDFRDYIIEKGYIKYNYFINSSFKNTVLKECIILSLFHDKEKALKKLSNISIEAPLRLSPEIKNLIEEQEQNSGKEKEKISREIFSILKIFKKNPKASYKKEKFKKKNDKVLEFLIKKNLIIEIKETTSEKRREKKLKLNENHPFYKQISSDIQNYNRPTQVTDELADEYLSLYK